MSDFELRIKLEAVAHRIVPFVILRLELGEKTQTIIIVPVGPKGIELNRTSGQDSIAASRFEMELI